MNSRISSWARRAITLMAAVSVIVVAAALVGCTGAAGDKSADKAGSADSTPSKAAFPVTVTDDASRTVTVKTKPARIVSLAPANTEILFALGLGDKVVGVTSYDDYPAEVKDIARVGDFAGPNLEAVAAANPDLVVATTGVQADVIKKLGDLGATVVAVDPKDFAGLYADIKAVGAVTGTAEKADALVESMQGDVAEIQQKIASAEPATAFVEIGQNPLFTTGPGTLLNEMVVLAGGKNVVTQAGYVPFSTEQLVKAEPDVYLATKGSSSDPKAIENRAGFAALSAIKNGRVVILDDNLVSRPGPRIVEGLRQIAEGLHPDAFGQ